MNIDCNQILAHEIETVIEKFKTGIKPYIEKLISCFYTCFKTQFICWGKINFKSNSTDKLEFILDQAFTDCILKFSEEAKTDKLYIGKAKVKTILFSYFKYTILNLLKEDKKEIKNKIKYKQSIRIEEPYKYDDEESREEYFKKLEKAMQQLNEMDRKIITWRHINLKTIDEIAAILDINKESTSNRIYRCLQRLKNAL